MTRRRPMDSRRPRTVGGSEPSYWSVDPDHHVCSLYPQPAIICPLRHPPSVGAPITYGPGTRRATATGAPVPASILLISSDPALHAAVSEVLRSPSYMVSMALTPDESVARTKAICSSWIRPATEPPPSISAADSAATRP